MNPVLQMAGVRLAYPSPTGPLPVFDGLSLQVAAGECVALVGPSGSGKSSILHVAAGLQRPDAGTVDVAGHELTTLAPADVARVRAVRLGLVFQAFHLLPHLSVLENVLAALWLAGGRQRDSVERAHDALDAVGLGGRVDHRPAQLSGGEQQRVGIARAIVKGPDLVLADEPTGNLDAAATEAVADLLTGLTRRGTAVLVATHDDRVASGADREVRLA